MNSSKFIVGLTGGIGAGKSTIASIFSSFGVNVIDADVISRKILDIYPSLLLDIFEYFGESVRNDDGTLNRKELGKIVFSDNKKLKYLENILHPKIRDEMVNEAMKASSSYAILMVPLLFEKSLHSIVNRVLCIDLEEDEQIKRTMQRDGSDKLFVEAIMNNQISRAERRNLSDDILYNCESFVAKKSAVLKFHNFYLKVANNES